MAGFTLAQAQAQLDAWMTASLAVSRSQQHEIDTGSGGRRMLRRADAAEIREQIKFWSGQVAALTPASAGGGSLSRTRYIVPE